VLGVQYEVEFSYKPQIKNSIDIGKERWREQRERERAQRQGESTERESEQREREREQRERERPGTSSRASH
jgi:hypothetical protein